MSKAKKSIIAFNYGEFVAIRSFKPIEFEGIKNEAGRNSFFLSAKKWIGKTGAIGLVSKSGHYV